MPSEGEKGVIKPLDPKFMPLIAWRLRNVAETTEPRGDDGPPLLHELPLGVAGRQDHGNGRRRPPEQQGPVRPLPDPAPGGDPQRERHRVEHLPGQAGRQAADRLHVAGLAGRAVRGDHHQRPRPGPDRLPAPPGPPGPPGELLRRQLQGLPLPAGVLPDPRHPGLVQQGHRQAPAAARGRRPALRAHQCRLEPRRELPGVRPGRGQGRLSAGKGAGGARERPERDADPVRPLPHPLQRAAGAASPCGSPALRRTA